LSGTWGEHCLCSITQGGWGPAVGEGRWAASLGRRPSLRAALPLLVVGHVGRGRGGERGQCRRRRESTGVRVSILRRRSATTAWPKCERTASSVGDDSVAKTRIHHSLAGWLEELLSILVSAVLEYRQASLRCPVVTSAPGVPSSRTHGGTLSISSVSLHTRDPESMYSK